MKTEIPEELTSNVPQTKWGKILLATPVVMTVIATLLAGLASSEMTRAQYDRALGAQLQSKAGDQWGYFQAKKLRGAMQRNSFELLTATADIRPIENPALDKVPTPAALTLDAKVEAALQAIDKQEPETEIAGLLKSVDDKSLAAALQTAKDNALAFDTATAPANQALDQLEKSLPAGGVGTIILIAAGTNLIFGDSTKRDGYSESCALIFTVPQRLYPTETFAVPPENKLPSMTPGLKEPPETVGGWINSGESVTFPL